MSEVIKEFVKIRFCLVCLSSDRNLYPIQDLTFFASLTLLQLSEAGAFALCWECNRIVKKAKLFRSKALKAQAVLNGRELANIPLSNISQRNLVNIIDIPPQLVSEDTNLINEELVLKTEFVPWSDQVDGDIQDSGGDVNDDDVKEEYCSSDDETLSNLRKDNMGYIEIDASLQHEPRITPTKELNEPVSKLQFVPILPKPGQSADSKTLKIEPLRSLTPKRLTPKKKVARTTPLYAVKWLTQEEMLEFRRKLEILKDEKLYCAKCCSVYETEADYDSHMSEHSESAGAFPCEICERRFPSFVAVRAHTSTHYRIYECNLCKEECMTHKLFVKHYGSRHQDVGFKCDQCDERLPTRSGVRAHKLRQHSLRVPCTECNKMVRDYLMKKHMELHKVHPPAQCDVCQKTFNGTLKLHMHKKSAHSDQGKEDMHDVFYCVKCDVKFKQQYNYKQHLERSSKHAKKDDVQKCPHCDKQFSCANYLAGHIKRTHTENRYKCDQCPKTCIYPSKLKQHIRKVHQNRQPPRDKVCDICGKAFFTGVVLRQHMNSHNNIRPFVCEYCGDAFSYSGARYTHIRLKHKNNKDKTDNNKTKTENNKTKTANNKKKAVNNKAKTKNNKNKSDN